MDWDKIHDINDPGLILFHGWATNPNEADGLSRLDTFSDGAQVFDRDGVVFTVLGAGAVQGSVVLRDPNGEDFQADAGMLAAPHHA